ncbi:MAG: acyl-CoA synthetase [Proteobacteria bacterium]|nr:acyl-CoA synthetase [Pseudomonadota bacterium]
MTQNSKEEGSLWDSKWSFFDGNPDDFNIAYECIDRHPGENTAIRIKFDDGRSEIYTFGQISELTSQFANMLEKAGVEKGERVAIMLPPSVEFYVCLFGTIKRGAVAIPFSPLFGPDAIEFRIKDSSAKTLIITKEKNQLIDSSMVSRLILSEDLMGMIKDEGKDYKVATNANDLAVMQYSSGTTGSPKSVEYRHKTITVQAPLMSFMKDEVNFCPSSPAWGHGIWYGTIGPLISGTAIGSYSSSGRFKPEILLEALEEFGVTVLSAAPTIFRLIKKSGKIDDYKIDLNLITYTGEYMEKELAQFIAEKFDVTIIGAYGTTELGPILINFISGPDDSALGALGRPLPGSKVAVLDDDEKELPPNEVGQIGIWRKDKWNKAEDAAYVDEDGCFWYKGRVDDVIISSGYTIGPDEIENVFITHPAVAEVGVIGTADKDRGTVVKAIVCLNPGYEPGDDLKEQFKDYIKTRLSRHEYPRIIEFIDELPKTADGKIKRKELRKREESL